MLLLMMAVWAAVSSCEQVEEVMDRITLSDEANRDLHFSGNGGSRSLLLKATTSWSAVSDQDWCTVTPSEGLVSDLKLTITVDANDSDVSRSSKVTVAAGNTSMEIAVTQDGRSVLSIGEADFEISEEGGSFAVELEHNVTYSVNIPENVTWIKEIKSKAMSETVHTFQVEANPGHDSRTAEIKFVSSDGKSEQSVVVLQNGQPMKHLVFEIWHENKTWTLPQFGGQFTGTVDWGDRSSSEFGTKTVHAYTYEGSKVVSFDLVGEPEDLEFTLENIVGVTRINLGKLR